MGDTTHAAVLRYWDSCAFLAIFNDEEECEDCQEVVTACKDGKTRIVTSALTLAEVLKVKNQKPLPIEKSNEITLFFEHSYIVVRSVTRRTAEFARSLVWAHGIEPKDAIHVATALEAKVPLMETKDHRLVKLGTLMVPNYPPLDIEKPWWYAPTLPGMPVPESSGSG